MNGKNGLTGVYGMPDIDNAGSSDEENTSIAGSWYVKLVKRVNKMFPSNPRALELKKTKLKSQYENAVIEEKMKENELRNIEFNLDTESKSYKKAYKEWSKAEKKRRSLNKAYNHPDFKEAISFIGLDVEYYQVSKLATLTMILFFIVGFIGGIIYPVIYLSIAPSTPQANQYTAMLLMYGPILFFVMILTGMVLSYFFLIYPNYLSKRLRIWLLGKTPEAVNYMAMSMALTPSLDRAISFASENLDEPMASAFKKVLWNVYTRNYSTIEESFIAFAYEWGSWNEELKRSFYTIRMSIMERTHEGVLRNLEKAKDIILQGTKRRIEDFASTLSTPTTILFALGVLLPMIIGSMLPMISLIGSGMNLFGGVNSSSSTGSATLSSTAPSGSSNAIPIIIVMDVIFPLVAFLYGYTILGRRPGTRQISEIPSPYTKKQRILILSESIVIGVLISLLAIPMAMGIFGNTGSIFYSAPIVMGISAIISIYFWKTTDYQYKKRKEMLKMEEEFPDALFQIGSRMMEGLSIENSLIKTSESMKGTVIGDLFNKIIFTMKISGKPIDNALFGVGGVLVNFPSKMIKVSMQTVVKLTTKEHIVAGKTIVEISTYLRDLKSIDSDIKHDLSGVVGMMKGTATFFAPLILGITASLYVLLAQVIGGITHGSGVMPVGVFMMILGVYLVLMVMIIGYYVIGLEFGEVWIERKRFIAATLPIAILLFLISAIAGQIAIGTI
ncbi:MAG: hypothetical protein M1481_07425 [Candidatus Thermoplasmatota archaeon]|jgi:Flp pilus assembly protein TadB|nr:hypothetical protein [Candidatus Thermoplasmatota archaeon]MCL5963436.1 hypothetical protein [Candidatus Thermoplasmatota archaeon]